MSSDADEYKDLKIFLGFFFDRHMVRPWMSPDRHPLNVLQRMESHAPRRARQGLRMAIADCIEMTADWAPEKVAAFDAELKTHGILTLSTVRRRYSRRLHSILKRGRIRTETEYYIVRGAIEDPSAAVGETMAMQTLLDRFESDLRVKRKKS